MARKPQVTRTITTTKATVLCMDIENETPIKKEVTLPRTYKDDAHVLKAVKAYIDTEKLIAVRILDTAKEECLYGMTEAKFIELAEKLPPRKAADEDTLTEPTDEQ